MRRPGQRPRPCPRTLELVLLDLFGEIPVTWPEVEAWCLAVAGLSASSPRFAWYVKNWNVAEKVRAAKVRGDLETILTRSRMAGKTWLGAERIESIMRRIDISA